MKTLLDQAKEKVRVKLLEDDILNSEITVKAKVLSAEEAIGNPEYYDFPLLKGKEKIVEANFQGFLGHAFTDTYGGFEGYLNEVLSMESTNNYRRALQVATINALSNYWGLVTDTVHCKDDVPKVCANKIKSYIHENYPRISKIAFIGYQPAMIDTLSKDFILKVLDLDKDNIGTERFGNFIFDGEEYLKDAVEWSELILATGSLVVNGTIDRLIEIKGHKDVLFYGVTISGSAHWLGLKRICFV